MSIHCEPDKLWYIHTVEHYSSSKERGRLIGTDMGQSLQKVAEY